MDPPVAPVPLSKEKFEAAYMEKNINVTNELDLENETILYKFDVANVNLECALSGRLPTPGVRLSTFIQKKQSEFRDNNNNGSRQPYLKIASKLTTNHLAVAALPNAKFAQELCEKLGRCFFLLKGTLSYGKENDKSAKMGQEDQQVSAAHPVDIRFNLEERWDGTPPLLLYIRDGRFFRTPSTEATKFWITFEGSLIVEYPRIAVVKLRTTLLSLYTCNRTKDTLIISNNGEAETTCHEQVLIARSPAFAEKIWSSPFPREIRKRKGRLQKLRPVVLNEISGIVSLNLLMRCLYGLEVAACQITKAVTVELFRIAQKYRIEELETYLLEIMIQKNAEWFTPDVVSELYTSVKDSGRPDLLRKHLVFILESMTEDDFLKCPRFEHLTKKEALDLLTVINLQAIDEVD